MLVCGALACSASLGDRPYPQHQHPAHAFLYLSLLSLACFHPSLLSCSNSVARERARRPHPAARRRPRRSARHWSRGSRPLRRRRRRRSRRRLQSRPTDTGRFATRPPLLVCDSKAARWAVVGLSRIPPNHRRPHFTPASPLPGLSPPLQILHPSSPSRRDISMRGLGPADRPTRSASGPGRRVLFVWGQTGQSRLRQGKQPRIKGSWKLTRGRAPEQKEACTRAQAGEHEWARGGRAESNLP